MGVLENLSNIRLVKIWKHTQPPFQCDIEVDKTSAATYD
jgi:hypothetical protein